MKFLRFLKNLFHRATGINTDEAVSFSVAIGSILTIVATVFYFSGWALIATGLSSAIKNPEVANDRFLTGATFWLCVVVISSIITIIRHVIKVCIEVWKES